MAVPRPKWNSSVLEKRPVRAGAATTASVAGDGLALGSAGPGVAAGSGCRDGAAVGAETGDPASGAGSPATAIGGSSSSVRMNTGDTRYQATGRPTTTATARSAPVSRA
jgi:hypothetical protein